jgi:hypothetical protein
MKELKDHLQEIGQMIEDEKFHFRSLLERVRQQSERLNRFSYGFFPKGEGEAWEEEKRL